MRQPNILFILADDQRFHTIHALGNEDIQTPHLDRLIREGTAFTHAHIPGGTSGAVCMPSRAMIHSGKSLFHLYESGAEIPADHTTMGECFRANGYHTIGIGKWHNGTASYARSFSDGDEIFFGGMWDHWNVPVNSYHPDGKYENVIRSTPDFFHANHPMDTIAERITAGKHSTELFTDAAIRFIRQPHEEPFFLYTALLAPHDPRTMPERFRTMYDPAKLSLPANFAADHFDFGINPSVGEDRDENLAAHPRTEAEIRQHLADYYAMISHIDEQVGRLLEALESTGQLENTIIVYTGDNGLAVGCHGLMGKQNLYEHSIRVPLILRGPDIESGAKRSAYVYLMDIYPTLCELCGLSVPDSVEGKSFKGILEDAALITRPHLYLAYTHLIRAIKDERFKLIRYKQQPEETQLFDLQEDPEETVNLYHDPSYQATAAALEALLLAERGHCEDAADNVYTQRFWNE